jgi:WD40 repeat protein
MDIDKVLTFTDALVFAKSGTHLSDLQLAMLRESWSWQRQSYERIADTYGYSPTYLKHDVGPKLWRLLSEVLGEKVNKTSFRMAIERRYHAEIAEAETSNKPLPQAEALTDTSQGRASTGLAANTNAEPIARRQDWGEAMDVSFFYGRQQELAQLQHWILDERCRLVALLGMGGMGKTSLSVKLAQKLTNEFDWVIWRSLRNAPPLEELLTDLLHVFSRQDVDDSDLDSQRSRLLHYLRSHRCLLIFDNIEAILPDDGAELLSLQTSAHASSPYRSGYESYGELFKQMGETLHRSCLVMTSREKPPEISLLEGAMLPVRSLHLNGLEPAAGQQLVCLKGEFQASEEEWNALINGYSGNPLALKLISTTVQTLFDGNISDFLQQNAFVFGNIRTLIEQQFERLSDPEKTVIYWLAIYREPASFVELRRDIFPAISPQALVEVLELLFQRSLIEKVTPTLSEKRSAQFSLQPVVMEYVTDRLVEQVAQDIGKPIADHETGDRQPSQPNPMAPRLSPPALLQSHALLKAQAKDYIREAQVRLILQPAIEQLQATLANDVTLDDHLLQYLTQFRHITPQETGYAGGNLLNLLCQRQSRLDGHDLSDLTIWQAYLSQVQLYDVNLARSDLSQSVFAETLGIVFGVAFSPDGDLLATGDAEGGLRLWQVADGQPLMKFEGHLGWVWSVAFSADGKTLASCSSDKTIRLWDIKTGQCLQVLEGHISSVWSVAFSADGQLLASGGDEPAVKLWEVASGQCLKTLEGHTGRILSVAFSTDGQTLASGSDDCTVRLWNPISGECRHVCSGHRDRVWSVAVAPLTTGNSDQTNLLASGSADRTIRLWDVASGQCLKTLTEHSDRVRSVAFSPEAQQLISSSDDQTVRVWQVQTGECLKVLRGHTSAVFSVAVNADGQTIASGSTDQTARLWNIDSARCLRTLKGYTNSVFSVVFSADGQTIASGSTDQLVRLWDVGSGQCLKTLLGHRGWVTSVAMHPDGHWVASGSTDQTVRLWDITTGQCLKVLQDHTNWVQSVAFSPTGASLASGGDDQIIRLWDVQTGRCLNRLAGHSSWVWAVSFSPDGDYLASSSEDQTIRLWSVQTGECLQILEGHTSRIKSIAFSPDGRLLSSASDDETVRLWDVSTGECLQILRGHSNNVWSVAFSPDGAVLASGGLDQTVKLWQVSDGVCLKTLPILTHSVRSSMAFQPAVPVAQQSTGKTQKKGQETRVKATHYALATGSHNGTIQIWNTQTGQCLQTLIPDRPYQGTNITGVTGITAAQRSALKALGAIER